MENQNYSLVDVVNTLSEKKGFILKTTAAAFIISIIVSLLLPVYYESQTIFYAASPDLGLPPPVGVSDQPRAVYGNDLDIDRVISIAESDKVYQFLIDSFSLYEHYDIDPSSKRSKFDIKEELEERYKVKKTKLGSIMLTVEDTDPDLSAKIANSARNFIDHTSQAVMKESQKQTLRSYNLAISQQEQAIRAISDSIAFYRKKYNIVDARSQGEVYSELVLESEAEMKQAEAMYNFYRSNGSSADSTRKYMAISLANKEKVNNLSASFDKYNSGSSKVFQLIIEYERLINQIAVDRQREKLLQSAYQSPFTALHVVEEAVPPVVKSRPKRSLIVLGATFLTALLTIAYLIVSSNFQQIFRRKG